MVLSDKEEEELLGKCSQGNPKYQEGNEIYLIHYVCEICNEEWPVCMLSHNYPKACPKGHTSIHIKEYLQLKAPNAKVVADILFKKYEFIVASGKKLIWVYDQKRGVWDYELADRVIREEAVKILGEKLKDKDIADIKLHLLTNIEVKMKEKGIDIENFKLNKISKYEGKGLLINFKNNTVYIDKEIVEIRPHKAEDYFRNALPWDFDLDDTKIPKNYIHFLGFLANGNPYHFIDLMEGLAWPLLPGYPIQQMFVLIGEGGNGKTTYLEKILALIYGKKNISTVSYQELAYSATGQQNFRIKDLFDSILNVSDDLPEEAIYNTGFIKKATGGSTLHADIKFVQGGIDFYNEAKMYFGGNSMPTVPNSADNFAFWRRFHFIQPIWIIQNQMDWDFYLEKLFKKETPAFLRFLVLFILPNMLGKTKFTFSETPAMARTTYLMNSNNVEIFAETKLKPDPNGVVTPQDLYKEYYDWCNKYKLHAYPPNKFFKEILNLPNFEIIKERHRVEGKEIRTYVGIIIKKEDTPPIPPNQGNEDFTEKNKSEILESYINTMFERLRLVRRLRRVSLYILDTFFEIKKIIEYMKVGVYRVSAVSLSLEASKGLNFGEGGLDTLPVSDTKDLLNNNMEVPVSTVSDISDTIDFDYIPLKDLSQGLQELNDIALNINNERLIESENLPKPNVPNLSDLIDPSLKENLENDPALKNQIPQKKETLLEKTQKWFNDRNIEILAIYPLDNNTIQIEIRGPWELYDPDTQRELKTNFEVISSLPHTIILRTKSQGGV